MNEQPGFERLLQETQAWSQTLFQHVEKCPECRQAVENLRLLSAD